MLEEAITPSDHSKKLSVFTESPENTMGEKEKSLFDDDELFLKKAIEEDYEKGVELLYKRYFLPLCSHAVKYVISKTIAEDLVSEVFFEMYRKKIFVGIKSSFRFYLFRSVRNRSFNYLKSEIKKNEPFEEMRDYSFSEEETPESISQFEEMYQDLQVALNALPISRRKIYMMNKFDGKNNKDIASELNLSVRTVEVQLYRSNKMIRSILKEKWLI